VQINHSEYVYPSPKPLFKICLSYATTLGSGFPSRGVLPINKTLIEVSAAGDGGG